jgi:glycosyltransferase involved in cell wall biosynthesis
MGFGGAEQVICQLVRGLSEERESAVVCLEGSVGRLGRDLMEEGIQVATLGRQPGFDFSLVLRLRRWLQGWRPDVLHCHQYSPWVYGWLASRGLGIRVVFTEHGRFHPDRSKPKRVLINPIMGRTSHALVAISNATLEALVRYEYLPRTRIALVYNGSIPLPVAESDRATVRAEFGIPKDALIVGTVSRLDPIKNQSMLLSAFGAAAQEHEGMHLLIVGDGPLGDELRAQAAAGPFADRIHFTGFRTDTARLLAAMNIYLLPSLSEGTSMTLLEAMSLALPCIVTDVGGNPEIVEADVTGLVVPSQDQFALTAAMLSLVESPDRAVALGRAGRRRFDLMFSLERMLDAYAAIYDGC